ncbi:hypothetical protein BDV98DRAFT_603041 [Pterulicium gracile]|uniref:Glucose-methanol-choline oxidoreductase N-terminal domain-containing protein n=1 Tax=Pterulicium gracile TaxID=1884261 RepID=A0A5C3QT01_9AGAR|nr:hypothetical protein BDV98DRAFT_603041 [Pterula gracilis]
MWSLLCLVAALVTHAAAYGVTTSLSAAANQTFDYIIIGGGLTGITVAARLAENPSISVLVIEAGPDDRTNPQVYDIYQYGNFFNSRFNWNWPTEQGRTIAGGKTLGGGSSINGAAYTRGLNAQYDAWSTLLEPSEASAGWNWQGLWSYMKKSETFSPPNSQQAAKGAQFIDTYHGYNGPVQVTYPDRMYGGPQQPAFIETIMKLTGIKRYKDLNGGTPNCVSMTPVMMNWRDQGRRSSAPAAYLTPVESVRTGWTTLVGHMVTKINFSGSQIPLVATGVEFGASSKTGPRYRAYARKEVILAAGAIQSPALLQLSGIGDAAILGPLGIATLVDLKTVGRNLQEQTMTTHGASGNFDPQGSGPSNAIAFPNIYQLFGSAANATVQNIWNSLDAWAASQAGSGLSAGALKTIYEIQANLIINNNAPVAELFFDTGWPDAAGIEIWPLLPFSRGNVKITSSDPFAKPAINVNYFSVDHDLKTQIHGARLVRKLFGTSPLKDILTGETSPGYSAVPDNNGNGGTDAAWTTWIRANFGAVSHPVGTAAMMRRSLGGVVNAQLKVYDTTNLRVADASIMPMQISAHLSSTLYGVAEKAADLIKAAQ